MGKKYEEYVKRLSNSNIMTMTEQELSDFLDYIMTEKLKTHCFDDVQRDTFKHLIHYFRLLQLQLNHIKARADVGKYYAIAITKLGFPEEIRNDIMNLAESLKHAENMKILQQIKDMEEE